MENIFPYETIVELFEKQVIRTPNNMAVTSQNTSITYKELNEQANQLAHYLKRLYIKPETVVVVCLDRTFELIITLIAVLKAGGAYLPVDPSYPVERLFHIVNDANAEVIITNSKYESKIKTKYNGIIINIDLAQAEISKETNANPKQLIRPENLMYIIYTSGSTGKPKGVMIEHLSLTNLVWFFLEEMAVKETDRVAATTAITFDIAELEIYLPLIKGASIVIATNDIVSNGAALAKFIERHNITIMQATPSLWQLLIDTGWQGKKDLKALCGGEKLHQTLVEKLTTKVHKLWNVYGPTETTVWSTFHKIENCQDISIGKPISNTKIYILDSNLNPLPSGEVGEIYISGLGLARGYINQKKLTEEKFLKNPFISINNENNHKDTYLYKTGDLSRYLPNGNIEYLGRKDKQIKLRGYRIELSEIESVLEENKKISRAFVILSEVMEEKTIVAYVAPHIGSEWNKALDEAKIKNVTHWKAVYENFYKQKVFVDNLKFNTIGWNSSYTGEPIDNSQMQDWLDNTIDRILSLNPQNVLEIGCGAGLVLFKLAPKCKTYTATDFSPHAINYIKNIIINDKNYDNVKLYNKNADDIKDIEAAKFDVIIINSVIQYFPDKHYLIKVINNSLEILKENGAIFIGDVRNYNLLEAYYASINFFNAEYFLNNKQIENRIKRAMSEEEELLLSPQFFVSLKNQIPRIKHVTSEVKRGKFINELTKFRYDVILFADTTQSKEKVIWIDCLCEKPSINDIKKTLIDKQPKVLGYRNISDARLEQDLKFLDWIKNAASEEAIVDYRRNIKDEIIGIDFEDLCSLAMSLEYDIESSIISGDTQPGFFSVVFFKKGVVNHRRFANFYARSDIPSRINCLPTTNNPLLKMTSQSLVSELRDELLKKLPLYMIPSAIIVLESFPLTLHGKIDVKSLPLPAQKSLNSEQHTLPTTDIGKKLAAIWETLLNISNIGIYDDFFGLGGHSLLSIRLLSRIKSQFGIEVRLEKFLISPTISNLEKILAKAKNIKSNLTIRKRKGNYAGLTEWQKSLLIHEQISGIKGLYDNHIGLLVQGSFDVNKFSDSLQIIIKRHRILRSYLEVVDGSSKLKIKNNVNVPFEYFSVTNVEDKDRQFEVKKIIEEKINSKFDLRTPPLLSSTVIKINEFSYIILLSAHHIITDGRTFHLLLKEISKIYSSNSSSIENHQEIDYVDYAYWNNEYVRHVNIPKRLRVLDKIFRNGIPTLNIDILPKNDDVQLEHYKGSLKSFFIEQELASRVEELAKDLKATPFLIYLAVFAILIHRYTMEDEIVIVSPIENRNLAEVEDIVGCFINTLPFYCSLSNNPKFSEVILRLKDMAHCIYQLQDIPFGEIVNYVAKKYNMNPNSLFRIQIQYEEAYADSLCLPHIEVEPYALDWGHSKKDLTLLIERRKEGCWMTLEYSTNIFNADNISNMIQHFKMILLSILNNPANVIGDLQLLSENEQKSFLSESKLYELNNNYLNSTIQNKITSVAELYPNNIAVIHEENRYTYKDLEVYSNMVAQKLFTSYIHDNAYIGVCLSRSFELIITMLGIWKAGGVYVPLDQTYPKERIKYMIEQTQLKLIITDSDSIVELLGNIKGIKVLQIATLICNTEVDLITFKQAHKNPIACIIFTSGTTGKPKGIELEHRGLVNAIESSCLAFGINEKCLTPLLGSISFDASLYDIFLPLFCGGSVLILNELERLEPNAIKVWFPKITTIHCNPNLMKIFLDVCIDYRLQISNLFHVILGGDSVNSSFVEKIKTTFSSVKIYIVYGPSETSILCTYYDCQGYNLIGKNMIGRPLRNSLVVPLDKYGNLVPKGISGELYFSGPGLARGYINQPHLTSQNFIFCPKVFGMNRVYKTGDIGRVLDDFGNIEFLGRKDKQIKIRGYRIEIGEIEATFNSYTGIKNSVIIPRKSDVQIELVAYIVLYNEIEKDTARKTFLIGLRAYLSKKLPEYMIPTAFVFMEDLPLNANGKIDLNKLPNHAEIERITDGRYVEPQTVIEKQLSTIWCNILKITKISIYDNFFKLGGNSLLAIRFISMARSHNLPITILQLFESPTIHQLAKILESIPEKKYDSSFPSITRKYSHEK